MVEGCGGSLLDTRNCFVRLYVERYFAFFVTFFCRKILLLFLSGKRACAVPGSSGMHRVGIWSSEALYYRDLFCRYQNFFSLSNITLYRWIGRVGTIIHR